MSDRPVNASWVAAIHARRDDFEPLGSGLVVDDRRVLTCAHVVTRPAGVMAPLWIAFPKVRGAPRRLVDAVRLADTPTVTDVAVLYLAEPLPEDVVPAPLRCPPSEALAGKPWWAFGFPKRDPFGNDADGVVGASLAYGWVRLDTESRYLVEVGFSGGGLWCPQYAAVVGLVGEAHSNGDGRAITLHDVDVRPS